MERVLRTLNKKFGYDSKDGTVNLYPESDAPVFIMNDGELVAKLMYWGFPVEWSKSTLFNAKAETAAEKKSFKESLAQRRCVIPTTGFYEFENLGAGKTKKKYLCRLPGMIPVYLAGMYERKETKDGQLRDCFTILTTEASKPLSSIHNRMPVILNKSEFEPWISNNEVVDVVLKRAGPELALIAV